MNIYIPFPSYGGYGLTLFYGIPDGNEIEISDLKGVPFSYVNTSTSANASGSLAINFPSGNVKITGIFVIGVYGFGQISFITGTGKTISIPVSDSPDPMDLPDNIYPMDLKSATTLSINYNLSYNSSGNASLFGNIYYE